MPAGRSAKEKLDPYATARDLDFGNGGGKFPFTLCGRHL